MNLFKILCNLVLKPLRALLRACSPSVESYDHIVFIKDGKIVYDGKEMSPERLEEFRESFRHMDEAFDHMDGAFKEMDSAFESLRSASGQKPNE